jgi:hypothetical protein
MKVTSQQLDSVRSLVQKAAGSLADATKQHAEAQTQLDAARVSGSKFDASADIITKAFLSGDELSDGWLKEQPKEVQSALGWTPPPPTPVTSKTSLAQAKVPLTVAQLKALTDANLPASSSTAILSPEQLNVLDKAGIPATMEQRTRTV